MKSLDIFLCECVTVFSSIATILSILRNTMRRKVYSLLFLRPNLKKFNLDSWLTRL